MHISHDVIQTVLEWPEGAPDSQSTTAVTGDQLTVRLDHVLACGDLWYEFPCIREQQNVSWQTRVCMGILVARHLLNYLSCVLPQS